MQTVAAIARARKAEERTRAAAKQAAQEPMVATNEAEATVRKVLQEGTVLFEAVQRDRDTLLRSNAALDKLRRLVKKLEGAGASDDLQASTTASTLVASSRVKLAAAGSKNPLIPKPLSVASTPGPLKRTSSIAADSPFGPVVAQDGATAVLNMPLGQAEQLERKLRFTYRSRGMSPYMVRLEKESIRVTRQVDKFMMLNRHLRDGITRLRRHREQLRVGREKVDEENRQRVEKLKEALEAAAEATKQRTALVEERDALVQELQDVHDSFRKEWGDVVTKLDMAIQGTEPPAPDKPKTPPVRVLGVCVCWVCACAGCARAADLALGCADTRLSVECVNAEEKGGGQTQRGYQDGAEEETRQDAVEGAARQTRHGQGGVRASEVRGDVPRPDADA